MDLLRVLLCLLPPSRLKNRVLSLTPGWRVHPTAHLSPSLVWRVGEAELGPRSRIGTGNAFREVRALRLAEAAEIGQWNWFSAAARHVPEAADADLRGELRLGHGAAITSRHYLDISGGLTMDRYSALGGVRSSVLTHSYDVRSGGQRLAPVRLGDHSLVFTASVLLPGASVGDRVVVGTNSTVSGSCDQPESLYAGSPAKPVASLAGAHWFVREHHEGGHRSMTRAEEDALLRDLKESERAGLA